MLFLTKHLCHSFTRLSVSKANWLSTPQEESIAPNHQLKALDFNLQEVGIGIVVLPVSQNKKKKKKKTIEVYH
jgi:hypothetical protein